jgi:hypothetical protein
VPRIKFKQLDHWQYQYLDPVLAFFNWRQQELRKLDRKTRKLQTIRGQLHPKADVDSLYFPRKKGGRGLMQLEDAYEVEIKKLVGYADKEDPLIQTVRTHEHIINSAVLQTARLLKRELQRGTRQKESIAEKTKERWRGRRLNGHCRIT